MAADVKDTADGNDEAAVGMWGNLRNLRNPFNPRFRHGGAVEGHARVEGRRGEARTGGRVAWPGTHGRMGGAVGHARVDGWRGEARCPYP